MFSVNRFFHSVIAMAMGSFLCVSCGSGSSGSSGSSSDSTGDSTSTLDTSTGLYSTTCGTVDNSYVDNTSGSGALYYGQMPSDINPTTAINACSSGQFVFNGQCYDSMSFDDSTGKVTFTKNGVNQVISEYNTPFSDTITQYARNLYSINSYNECNVDDPYLGTHSEKECLIQSGNIYYFYKTPYGITNFGYTKSNDGLIYFKDPSSYPSIYSTDINFKVDYGTCYSGDINTSKDMYVWYTNGSVTLSGNTYSLPLSESNFLSENTDAVNKHCNNLSGYFDCYQVATSWGSYVAYFDTNKNFEFLTISYNGPTN